MPVITMSGNIASGAREIGQGVAEELGIPFVDQQLMVEAAQRCGAPVGTGAEHDERRGSFRAPLSALLRTGSRRRRGEQSKATARAAPSTRSSGTSKSRTRSCTT